MKVYIFLEFTCPRSRLCLTRYQINDGQPDCNASDVFDISDELSPLPACSENEFQCLDDSKRCIPREWVMDGAEDCQDNSDEAQPLSNCNEYEFLCEGGQCIPRYRVLDGHVDCNEGDDEAYGVRTALLCRHDEFKCKDIGRCIPRSWANDGVPNCNDTSDESTEMICLPNEFTCMNKFRCLPKEYVCDGIDHCGDCSDEIEGCDEPRMWRCPKDSSTCILQSYACDGFGDCPELNDNPEHLPGFKCTKSVFLISTTQCVIPQWTLHDDFSVCEDKSDICYDKNNSFTCSNCVSDDNIIANTQVCNGFVDCHDLTDECICNYQNSKAPEISRLCDSICYPELSSPACEQCKEGELFCSSDEKCIGLDLICDGVIDCPLSKVDEKVCTNTPFTVNASFISQEKKDFNCTEIPQAVIDYATYVGVYDPFSFFIAANATR